MKTLILSIVLGMSFNAMALVECEKQEGGRWYPKNELAKDIANKLGVKTCSGKRFKEVVSKLGETTNIVQSSTSMSVDEVVSAIKK